MYNIFLKRYYLYFSAFCSYVVLCIVLRLKGSKAQIVSPIRSIIFNGAKEIYINLDDIRSPQ